MRVNRAHGAVVTDRRRAHGPEHEGPAHEGNDDEAMNELTINPAYLRMLILKVRSLMAR